MEMKGGEGGYVYGVYVYGVYTISRSAELGRIWHTSEVGEGYAERGRKRPGPVHWHGGLSNGMLVSIRVRSRVQSPPACPVSDVRKPPSPQPTVCAYLGRAGGETERRPHVSCLSCTWALVSGVVTCYKHTDIDSTRSGSGQWQYM
jgi:hypothetical protein